MAYTIKFSPHAAKSFRKLPRTIQGRLYTAIDPLKDNPRLPGTEKLKGSDKSYRIRVGDYRILYEIVDEELIVYIIETGHRHEVYRK